MSFIFLVFTSFPSLSTNQVVCKPVLCLCHSKFLLYMFVSSNYLILVLFSTKYIFSSLIAILTTKWLVTSIIELSFLYETILVNWLISFYLNFEFPIIKSFTITYPSFPINCLYFFFHFASLPNIFTFFFIFLISSFFIFYTFHVYVPLSCVAFNFTVYLCLVIVSSFTKSWCTFLFLFFLKLSHFYFVQFIVIFIHKSIFFAYDFCFFSKLSNSILYIFLTCTFRQIFYSRKFYFVFFSIHS